MPSFTDVEVLREYADMRAPAKNPLLESALDGVEAFVQRYTRRQFQPEPATLAEAAVTKRFNVRGPAELHIPDIRIIDVAATGGPSPVSVSLAGLELAPGLSGEVGSYELDGVTIAGDVASHVHIPATTGVAALEITGRWGWDPIPGDLLDALYTHAARRLAQRDARYADTVQTAEGGMLAYFRSMPADVKATYDSLRIFNFAVISAGGWR